MSARRLVSVAVVAVLAGYAPDPAVALERSVSMVSTGDLSPGDQYNGGYAVFEAASADFARIVFRSSQPFAFADTDQGGDDIFVHEKGKNRFVSAGPAPPEADPSGSPAQFLAASPNAKRILWLSREHVTADDVDSTSDGEDLFVTEGGHTRLVSTGPVSRGHFNAEFGGVSRDLRRIVFTTGEQLVPGDQDDRRDVYLRSGSTTSLISQGSGSPESDVLGGRLPLVSDDGTRIFFTSEDRLTPSDTDAQKDGFEWSAGKLHEVTLGPAGGNAPLDAGSADPFRESAIEGISQDGRRAWFYSPERLTADDRDDRMDLYERAGGKTRLVSTGPAGGNGEFDVGAPKQREADPFHYGRLEKFTPDGSRVFFGTFERLTKDDRDDFYDIYLRTKGKTTLVSPAGRGETSSTGVSLAGLSPDGRRAFLASRERLTDDDKDDSADVFSWTDGGRLHRLSVGPRGGNADKPYFSTGVGRVRPTDAFVELITSDGRVAFIETAERLTGDDRDKGQSLYESRDGSLSLVRLRTKKGAIVNMHSRLDPAGVSANGRDFAFDDSASLSPDDSDDGAVDVYLARLR